MSRLRAPEGTQAQAPTRPPLGVEESASSLSPLSFPPGGPWAVGGKDTFFIYVSGFNSKGQRVKKAVLRGVGCETSCSHGFHSSSLSHQLRSSPHPGFATHEQTPA